MQLSGGLGWGGIRGGFSFKWICVSCLHVVCWLSPHAVTQMKCGWPYPTFFLFFKCKGNGIWHNWHGLIGFIRSHKLEGQIQNPHLPVSLFEPYPTLSICISPYSLQSSFSSLPLTFSFLSSSIPIYSSILSSTLSLNPAILLTFQFHSSSISLPLLSSWSGL